MKSLYKVKTISGEWITPEFSTLRLDGFVHWIDGDQQGTAKTFEWLLSEAGYDVFRNRKHIPEEYPILGDIPISLMGEI